DGVKGAVPRLGDDLAIDGEACGVRAGAIEDNRVAAAAQRDDQDRVLGIVGILRLFDELGNNTRGPGVDIIDGSRGDEACLQLFKDWPAARANGFAACACATANGPGPGSQQRS